MTYRGVMVAAVALAVSAPVSAAVTLTFDEGTYSLLNEDELAKTYSSEGVTFITTGLVQDGVVEAIRGDRSNSAFVIRFGPFKVDSFDLKGSGPVTVKASNVVVGTLAPGQSFQSFGPYSVLDEGSFLLMSDSDFTVDNVVLSAAIPEPTTWAMLVAGFGLLGVRVRRRRIAVA